MSMDSIAKRVITAFDQNNTAAEFLSPDGEGGFAGGVYRMANEIDALRRALSVALKLYETDQLTRLGEHLKASVDPWADRDADVYGPDMEDER